MSKDKIIISAVHIVLKYCHDNDIFVGSRSFLWSRAVTWGRKVLYETPESLAAAIISDSYEPVSFREAEELQKFYFEAIFE